MSTSVANASLKLSAHQAKHYINMQIRELNPLRELAVHSTMILNLLSNEVSVGLTDSEKVVRLAEIKKEAIKVMAVDSSIQSFNSIKNND